MDVQRCTFNHNPHRQSPPRGPRSAIWAQPDANNAALQRLQIIRGWLDGSGETQETVIDVACAGHVAVNLDTKRCPDNGASVDLSNSSYNADTGDAELRKTWTDPNFKVQVRAFYYARVPRNPTCRWNTWDAIKAGTKFTSW